METVIVLLASAYAKRLPRHPALCRIGRLPIAAFGDADGDIALLQTTSISPESKKYSWFGAFVWHTNAVREYAYNKDKSVGRLDKGLALAPQLGWYLIDMKRDWT